MKPLRGIAVLSLGILGIFYKQEAISALLWSTICGLPWAFFFSIDAQVVLTWMLTENDTVVICDIDGRAHRIRVYRLSSCRFHHVHTLVVFLASVDGNK